MTLAAIAGPEPNEVDQTGLGGDEALFFWCAERGCRIEPEPSLLEVCLRQRADEPLRTSEDATDEP